MNLDFAGWALHSGIRWQPGLSPEEAGFLSVFAGARRTQI